MVTQPIFEVGQVLAAAAMSPEQHALFKPAVAQKLKEATDSVPRVVNPSFEVRQVKWPRQALKVLGGHVLRASNGWTQTRIGTPSS